MKLNEYQEKARFFQNKTLMANEQLENSILGLVGESGELADAYKKSKFQGHPFDTVHALKEIGDLLWYIALACDALGETLEDVARMNLKKLGDRYPNGFSSEASINRKEFKAFDKEHLQEIMKANHPKGFEEKSVKRESYVFENLTKEAQHFSKDLSDINKELDLMRQKCLKEFREEPFTLELLESHLAKNAYDLKGRDVVIFSDLGTPIVKGKCTQVANEFEFAVEFEAGSLRAFDLRTGIKAVLLTNDSE